MTLRAEMFGVSILNAADEERLLELLERLVPAVERLEALLGQQGSSIGEVAEPNQPIFRYTFGDVVVYTQERSVSVNGREVRFGRLEYETLEYLCRNRGVAVSRGQIGDAVFGRSVGDARLKTLVARVRRKLGDSASFILPVPRYGYILRMI